MRRVAATVAVDAAEVQVGVTGVDVPVRRQRTGDLQVDTVGFLAGAGLVGIATGGGGQAVVEYRLVLLLGAEVRRRCIQPPVQPRTLDTGFVALATDRLDLGAAGGLGGLRVEDVGVAGVERVGVVEVIHRTQVRRDDAAVLLVAAHAADAVGGGRVIGGAHTDDHRERIGDAEAGGGVHALEARGGLAVTTGA